MVRLEYALYWGLLRFLLLLFVSARHTDVTKLIDLILRSPWKEYCVELDRESRDREIRARWYPPPPPSRLESKRTSFNDLERLTDLANRNDPFRWTGLRYHRPLTWRVARQSFQLSIYTIYIYEVKLIKLYFLSQVMLTRFSFYFRDQNLHRLMFLFAKSL